DASSALQVNPSEKIDWNYPLGLVTMSFMWMGVFAFFRLLPLSPVDAGLFTFAFMMAWRYVVHRAGIFPWRWRGALGSGLLQGVLNGLAFFVFGMALLSLPGDRPISSVAVVAAIGGLIVGLLSINSKR